MGVQIADQKFMKNKLVYTTSNGISVINLNVGDSFQIPQNFDMQYGPSIYGNNIVYKAHDYGETKQIDLYNLDTKQTIQLANATGYTSPDIWGDKVVYVRDKNIYMHDLITNQETQITTSGNCWSPSIYDNKIVYSEYIGYYDIYVYDLITKTNRQITDNSRFNFGPQIWENKIVYHGGPGGAGSSTYREIYMYDLVTNEETRITFNNGQDSAPSIYGNKIVWVGQREPDVFTADHNIYMYDLDINQEFQITNDSIRQTLPYIFENIITWIEYGPPGGGIYMTTIPENLFDEDNDGVPNNEDKCPNTEEEQIIYGCSCNQILELKPGKDKSSKCSPGIIKVFTKGIGWAKDLF